MARPELENLVEYEGHAEVDARLLGELIDSARRTSFD